MKKQHTLQHRFYDKEKKTCPNPSGKKQKLVGVHSLMGPTHTELTWLPQSLLNGFILFTYPQNNFDITWTLLVANMVTVLCVTFTRTVAHTQIVMEKSVQRVFSCTKIQ